MDMADAFLQALDLPETQRRPFIISLLEIHAKFVMARQAKAMLEHAVEVSDFMVPRT